MKKLILITPGKIFVSETEKIFRTPCNIIIPDDKLDLYTHLLNVNSIKFDIEEITEEDTKNYVNHKKEKKYFRGGN